MIAKSGLGLIGIGAISIGGVAVTKPHWLGMDYMPKWEALNKDSNFSGSNDYTTNTFGKKQGRYLVSTNKPDNKNWWEWSFRRLDQKSKRSEKFKNVEGGYDGNNSLKNVCDEAYKKQEGDSHFDDVGTDQNKFKKADVWKYCSPLGEKPTTVKEVENDNSNGRTATYQNNTLGKTNEDKLISTIGNDKFWAIRESEFKNLVNVDADSYFAKHKHEKTIRDLCKHVYGQDEVTTGVEKMEKNTTLKYCSYDSTVS